MDYDGYIFFFCVHGEGWPAVCLQMPTVTFSGRDRKMVCVWEGRAEEAEIAEARYR